MRGETGPVHLSQAMAMVMAGLLTLSCWNVLEISFYILTTFRRYRGLYFWSMVIATFGILLHAVTGFLRYFALAPNLPMCFLICLGWYAMVTGQSVVLYSRLHLVTTHEYYRRWVLVMIIVNFCILHIPTTILFLGANNGVENFVHPFSIYEQIQLVGFALQETVISALYVWETTTSLRPLLSLKGPRGTRVIINVVLVNVIAVLLDAALVTIEFTHHFDVQTTFKPVVYSIKLLLEFIVLNSLLAAIQTPAGSFHNPSSEHGQPDVFVRGLDSIHTFDRPSNPSLHDPERLVSGDRRTSSGESVVKPLEIWNSHFSHP
ncbi:hypothetical protein N7539_005146 [Penicillium diatomitis]|uniref:DUF7703 domain-containing protein n=1 Tax=Penicillium diatomitis TaxID=2819901 RepID=A0A9X0BUG0_9EURO|nr:uncharacterized protein N7539_005146 [Penicillium diatomitis]KAJ5485158.1 hypothetical protein N7539_005146 [Penicillium diatomitis]